MVIHKMWKVIMTVLLLAVNSVSSLKVSGLDLHFGSTNGGTMLKVLGSGFADDSFNFGDGNAHLGNEVFLTSTTHSYQCTVDKDATDENTIACYTESMPEGTYYVQLKVNGEEVPDDVYCGGNPKHFYCSFLTTWWRTPTIYGVNPSTSEPENEVTLTGRMFTDKTQSSEEFGSNEITASIARVWSTGQKCELYKTDDELYGVQLFNINDSDDYSNHGTITCKVEGKNVASQNITYIVDGDYGRSMDEPVIVKVSADYHLHNYQTYAIIESVTPTTGSTNGGLVITVTGNYFDDDSINVNVGGDKCEVIDRQDPTITCRTPASATSNDVYPGSRGIRAEIYPGLADASSIEDVTYEDYTGDKSLHIVEKASVSHAASVSPVVVRMKGFFLPAKDGTYLFSATVPDTQIYISTDNTRANKALQSGGSLLTAGNMYYYEVVHSSSSTQVSFDFNAYLEETDYVSAQTSMSKEEIQEIITESPDDHEIQTITLNNWEVNESPVNEIISLCVTCESITDCTGSEQYVISLNGITSWGILSGAVANTIKYAIIGLLPMGGDTVEVTKEEIVGNCFSSYTITVQSTRGSLPLQASPGDATAISTAFVVLTAAVPSKDSLTVALNGFPSGHAAVDNTYALASAVQSLFGTDCPVALDSGIGSAVALFFDFETNSLIPGTRTAEDSYCGSYSLKNPNSIFVSSEDIQPYTLSSNSKFCLAYKGSVTANLEVDFTYTEGLSTVIDSSHFSHTFTESADEWTHICINLFAVLNEFVVGQNHALTSVSISLQTSDNDFFIDNIFLGSVPWTDAVLSALHLKRRLPLTPHRVSSVSVAKADDVYTVTMVPVDCAYSFPLLGIAFATGDGIGGYTHASWNGSSITVAREQFAAPPVGGTFDLTMPGDGQTYGGTLEDIPYDEEIENLKYKIEGINGIEEVSLTREGSCRGYKWSVTFKSPAGRQGILTPDGANLANPNANISTNLAVQGGLYLHPIPGDWVRIAYTTPQIEIAINNVPSKCVGACSFEWSEDATPTATAATSAGMEWTVTGTKFSTVLEENTVTIGGVDCVVTAASETSITCTQGESPAGTQELVVNVNDKGNTAPIEVAIPLAITNVSPITGSNLGGTEVTLTGTGFSTGISVTVGDSPCTVSVAQYTSVTCTTGSSAEGTGVISATVGGETATVDTAVQYTFETFSATGSLSPTTFSVLGGSLTISGSGFGTTQPTGSSVFIDSKTVNIISWSDTEISVIAPPLAPASYPVSLYLSPFGNAELTESAINYVFKVNEVTPTSVSMMGGVELTVNGDGFTENTEVTVNGNDCVVSAQSATSLTCAMSSCGQTHTVDNYGTSAVHGKGYAWNPNKLTIPVGDVIEWNWSAVLSTGTLQVFSTSEAASVEYDDNGFNSGSGTKTGIFSYQFNIPGTYYYGGCANTACDVFLRGVITVEEAADVTAGVSVRLNEYEALYVDASDVTLANGISVNCQVALTPIITEISPSSGSSDDLITITGSGFSTVAAATSVFVGNAECTVAGITDTSVTCKVAIDAELSIGLNQEVTVKVVNKGSSRTDIRELSKRYFALTPHISTVSPAQGSLAGGTTLTIMGGGLTATSKITIGGIECVVVSSTYTSVECMTGQSDAGANPVVVEVFDNGITIEASCIATECPFEYRTEDTPTMTGITPTSVSGTTAMSITGTGFGVSSTVSVKIGSTECVAVPGDVTDSTITCTVDGLPVGDHTVDVIVVGKGRADAGGNTFTVNSLAEISSIVPAIGSINGGTDVTITGNGFLDDSTGVTIGGQPCTLVSVSLSTIVCTTPAAAAGQVDIVVTSNSIEYVVQTFEYSTDSTPTITAVSPSTGVLGAVIGISGTQFGSTPYVTIGDIECVVTSSTDAEIECTLGSRYGGMADISASVPGLGLASVPTGVSFEYTFSIDTIDPVQGSLGGGQSVTITGNGFASVSEVEICGQQCSLTEITSATSITCITPATTTAGQCDVRVSNSETDSVSLALAYTYDTSLTPQVTSVSPSSGGTGGGTVLTITGSGLSNPSSVMIDGSNCVIDTASITDTEIQCTTDSHTGTMQAKVEVYSGTHGIAPTDNADFYFIDRWSSVFTWGGASVPQDDDLVVIQQGQTILLDTTTNRMSMLLIMGGNLIFEDAGEVHLNANNILITDGGLLQVGTEEEPYTGKATITMHGHLRSPELPIYGAKTLGVREGRLELHGKPVDITWAMLDETASAGSTEIVLQMPVPWSVGDQIVISTTGLRHSQSENEQREIAAITTANGKSTITLTIALEYEHLGVTESYTTSNHGVVDYEYRAEVGLLTRNVVFQGSDDAQWHDVIERCPNGFNTGMFSTQTCFQGRFGEEVGSDQYGASIMMHSKYPTIDPNNPLASAHIEFVELTYVGQAFRLGRYPIHWHLMGNVEGMYVRGCSIHKTFNRAITIHGTHNLMIEHNVVYNVMGGAIFIEDGIETGNTIQYNLAVFVKQSTSLLNDDITPAAFWATNPNNTFQHNHAAGGTHFGFWYRMNEHPDGPSYDANICQRHAPLGTFQNNTVHSQGWFGLWVFRVYTPMEGASCGSNTPLAAKFRSLTTWHCEKGAEWVVGGALQFIDFRVSSNEDAGIDLKLVTGSILGDEDRGAMVKDSIIIGHANFWSTANYESTVGIRLPMAPGLSLAGNTFININQGGHSAFTITTISGTCVTKCGGFHYRFSETEFIDVPRRIQWSWEHEGVIDDLDGTFADQSGPAKIVPFSAPYIDTNGECVETADVKFGSSVICDSSVQFHRFAFNNPTPSSLEFKNAFIYNQYGNSSSLYLKKRLTHKLGWMFLLRGRETYKLVFENVEQVTNISYTGSFYDIADGDYVIMRHELYQKPDRIIMYEGDTLQVGNTTALTADSPPLSWHYDIETSNFDYIVRSSENTDQINVSPSIYRCFYTDCITPIDTGSLPDVAAFPDNYTLVTDASVASECLVISNSTTGDYNDITIPEDCWVKWAAPITTVNEMHVRGNLVFDSSVETITLSATHIVVQGRFIAGWAESDPYQKKLHIILRGHHRTPEIAVNVDLTLGSKAIGCFGVCDIHGLDRGVMWTRLGQTVAAGSTQITLQEPVTWVQGDLIIIAPSGYNAWQGEKRTIAAVSVDGRIVDLTEALAFEHKGQINNFGTGWDVDMSAEVGLLTRNIIIEGEDYDDLFEESFGVRLLVATIGDLTAKARLSNVEFFHSGQDGWFDSYDPRYSVAWVGAGGGSEIINCAFHDGFSPAIGTFATNGVKIINNIVYHTVRESIVLEGSGHTLESNLVILNIFEGSYQERFEDQNFLYYAAVNVENSLYLTMKNNAIAGAERAGYRIAGQPCDNPVVEIWSGNVVHAALIGVFQMSATTGSCSLVNGFNVYKSWDYGYYHQTPNSVKLENTTIIDSTVGYLPLIVGPAALTHTFEHKYAQVTNCLFVGRSDPSDCSHDMNENNDDNLILRKIAGLNKQAPSTPTGGKTGIMLPMFESGYNAAPFKSFIKNKNYPALYGMLRIQDVTVYNYATVCSGQTDLLFYTNPDNEDAVHPTYVSGITQYNVEKNSIAFFDRPSIGKINPADCVDMQCDAKLKVMIKDTDGSLLGQSGTILPQAEYGWDGDRRLGVGDFRIPKTLLTEIDGTRIEVDAIAPNKGIVRNSACEYIDEWQAYECIGDDTYNYKMLVIESLDDDTEVRRLSPVALLCNGYIDLNNGPQDHGWCSGYTCQKRISTFYTLIATGQHYEIHFTGTPPQNMRLHLINAEPTDKLTIAIWIPNPQTLEISDGAENLRLPQNAYLDTNDGRTKLAAPSASNPDEFKPTLSSLNGANFLDFNTRLLYMTVGGENAMVTIRMKPTITIGFGFPAISVTAFFEEDLINNLALLLGISKDKIRVVEVVRETSRKRRSDTVEITLQVETSTNEEAKTANEIIIDVVQRKSFHVLGEEPILRTFGTMDDESIAALDSSLLTGTVPTNGRTILVPDKIELAGTPFGEETYIFTTPVAVNLLDTNDNLVSTSSWTVTVEFDKSHADSDASATMVGTTTVTLVDGVATFTDLVISHSGTYILTFDCSATNISDITSEITVAERTVSGNIEMANSNLPKEGSDLLFNVQLKDVNNNDLPNPSFKYNYKLDVGFDDDSMYSINGKTASITGISTFTFDGTTGNANTTGLLISSTTNYAIYNLKFRLYTDPPSNYDNSIGIEKVQIYPTNEADYIHVDIPAYIGLDFKTTSNHDDVLGSSTVETMETSIYNNLATQYSTVYFTPFTASKDTDDKLKITTTASSKTEDNLNNFVKDFETSGLLRFGSTNINLETSCGIVLDGVCYGQTTTSSNLNTTTIQTAVSINDDNQTTIIIFATLAGCVLLSAVIIVTTCIVKRQNTVRKVSALRCMNNSQTSTDSGRQLTGAMDNFQPASNAEWVAPDYDEAYRMTPVAAP